RAALDVQALAAFVLERENVPEGTEVSITFTTNDEIHALNRDFRGTDRPTDLLSFECDGVEEPEGEESLFNAGDTDVLQLGDIVIPPDVGEAQTGDFGSTLTEELCLLVAHGLLHLCGWDHMEEAEALEMEAREQELISEFLG